MRLVPIPFLLGVVLQGWGDFSSTPSSSSLLGLGNDFSRLVSGVAEDKDVDVDVDVDEASSDGDWIEDSQDD